jgi:outer membrane protein, multidrug efflux system
VLLGQTPGALNAELGKHQPVPVPPPEIAVGLPAEVLRRRPDVRRAERDLAAQTARVGVATADLYPKFTLLGSIGVEDALTAYGKEMIRRQSLLEAEHATLQTVEIAQNRYLAGESDFLTVLEAQRSLLTIQDQLAASNVQVTTNVVSLYNALGGGWTTVAPEEAGRAQR